MFIQVALSNNIFQTLTYKTPDSKNIRIGSRVLVPLLNRATTGWVIKHGTDYSGRVKSILGLVSDNYIPSDNFLNFINQVSQNFICSPGLLLDYSLSVKRKGLNNLYIDIENTPKAVKNIPCKQLTMLSKQNQLNFYYKNDLATPLMSTHPAENNIQKRESITEYHVSFEHLEYLTKLLLKYQNQNILLLTPDNITAQYLHEKFNSGILYSSILSQKKREEAWEKIVTAKNNLIIGGLSAVLLPLNNIGAIIFEKAAFFKSFKNPYQNLNTNKIAEIRSETNNIDYYEFSSAPSIKSLFLANTNSARINDQRIILNHPVQVKRLENKKKKIPDEFLESVREIVAKNKKILVIASKKKSFDYPFCFNCKMFLKCKKCKGLLRIEQNNLIRCLVCRNTESAVQNCQKCSKPLSIVKDISIEAIHKNLANSIGANKILLIDKPALSNGEKLSKMISDFEVTLATIGIISPRIKGIFDEIIYLKPESFFDFNNFTGSEIIYQAVNYLRGLLKKDGQITLYSSFFFHYSLKFINDENSFIEREDTYRKWFFLPPYFDLYRVDIKDKNLRNLANRMREIFDRYKEELNIRKIYLKSSKKSFGSFRGVMELHPEKGSIINSNILNEKKISLTKEDY